MPIYCYKCFDCNHYDEIKQSMDDDALTVCPECGGDNYKRVITNVGVIFKGSGFHVTDYRSSCKTPKKSPKADTDKAKSDSSSESGTAKADSKSDSGGKKNTEAA